MRDWIATTRRNFFREAAAGFGSIALTDLLRAEGVKPPHFPAKAKNVIFLFMENRCRLR